MLQSHAGIAQLARAQLDLPHAEQAADQRRHRQRIPAIGPSPKLTHHLFDGCALALVLVAHDVGENLLFGFGQRLLAAGEEVVGFAQGLGERGLVVTSFEHPQIGEREGDKFLGDFVETIARLAVIDAFDF